MIQNRYDDDDVDESQFEGLDVRHWHKNSIVGQVLWKIDVINRGRDQLKVEIGIEQEEGDTTPMNAKLPVSSYYHQVLSSNVSAKPVAALIQKIDPSKPFGKFKLTIGVKHIYRGNA